MAMQVEFLSRRKEDRIKVDLSSNDERFVGSEGDIVVEGKDVRARHARILTRVSGLVIEPVNHAPLAINGEQISVATTLADGDWLAFGATLVQVRIYGDQPIEGRRGSKDAFQVERPQEMRTISIGRHNKCDLVIPSPLVSREHAKLLHDNGKILLNDLNSTNGTFINGKRIFGQVPLRQGDKVEIAAFAFVFTGESLEPIDTSGRVRLEVRRLCKEVRDPVTGKPKRLLDDINLVIEPGEFVAIFGTSGSGKSTLLDALNGRRPATSGQILYNGTDFYGAFDLFRTAIGYVPQQDIVHRKIYVQHALRYSARLRLPLDTSNDEIDAHIDRVLKQVGLGDKAKSPIDTPAPLSGGQLKRVCLAGELIANPNVLFLDEVTSGLDAGTDKKMMHLFAELAAEQKTVICATHTLENIDACHLVLLMHRGRIVYYGPPREAIEYFGVSKLTDVYELIETHPAGYWADKFLKSAYYVKYIADRQSTADPLQDLQQTDEIRLPAAVKRRWFDWPQTVTLIRRYIDLLLSDRGNLALLLLQAPLVAVLVGLVFDPSGPLETRAATENQIAFILVLSAIYCGCLNSTREVVKELPVYLHERAVNLGIGSYLFSKLLPLSILCLVQCIALLGIVTVMVSWPGDFFGRLGTLFLAALAATNMGLAVSTYVDTSDKALTLIPILLVPQVILCNPVVQLGRVWEAIVQVTIIAFPSFDAMKAMLSEEIVHLVPAQNTFSVNCALTTAVCIGFLLAALGGLKLKDRRS